MTGPVAQKINYFGQKPKEEPSFAGRVGSSLLNCGGTALLGAAALTALVATIGLSILSYVAFATGIGIGVGIVLSVGALATGVLTSYAFSKSIDCFMGVFGSFC